MNTDEITANVFVESDSRSEPTSAGWFKRLPNSAKASWMLLSCLMGWILMVVLCKNGFQNFVALAGLFGISHLPTLVTVLASILKVGLEAGMVGALADWYAITVLFRDPFGSLPVPKLLRDHTRIIPNKKDKIAEELGRFVQEHFLAPSHVEQGLRHQDVAGTVASFLLDDAVVRGISTELRQVALVVLSALDDPEAEKFIQEAVVLWVGELEVHLLASKAIVVATDNDFHKEALQWGLDNLNAKISEHRPALTSWIRGKISDFGTMGKVALWFGNPDQKIIDQTLDELHAVMKRDNHPFRLSIDIFIRDYALKLQQDHSEEKAQLLALRKRLVESPEVVNFVTQLLRNVRDSIKLDLLRDDSRIARNLEGLAHDVARRLQDNKRMRELINSKVTELATHFADRYAEDVVGYIGTKVGAWDATTMATIIEDKVGQDLHFIRINGLIIGGMIGIGIGTANFLLGG